MPMPMPILFVWMNISGSKLSPTKILLPTTSIYWGCNRGVLVWVETGQNWVNLKNRQNAQQFFWTQRNAAVRRTLQPRGQSRSSVLLPVICAVRAKTPRRHSSSKEKSQRANTSKRKIINAAKRQSEAMVKRRLLPTFAPRNVELAF